jgi:hypothetical protein
MSNTIGNYSAFARPAFYHPEVGFSFHQEGCTKREHFAAMAMQGLMANNINNKMQIDILAKQAVYAADELINALNETK